MILKKGVVTLRAIENKDNELLQYMINAPEIEMMTCGGNFPISTHQQEKWTENYSNSLRTIRWMIELNNGKTIGMMVLQNIDLISGTALIEYKTSAKAEDRIKGDMVDAINAVLEYAFNELRIHCVTAIILSYNTFSLKLIKKVGFVQEGILRSRYFKKGQYWDVISFSLLAEEFLKSKE